jgi:hypothetical protein
VGGLYLIMAKNLTFSLGKTSYSAAITKIDRNKVYGFVEEQVLDKNGNICTSGNLLDDGQTLILTGATALKTVTANNEEVDKKTLKTVYMDGTDATLVPSSYDGIIELAEATPDDLFNLEVTTVYQLTWEDATAKDNMVKELEDGKLFRFVFNYRADYEGADAIILSSQNEVFVLTGRLLEFDYLENKTAAPVTEVDNTEQEEEVDFGML